jgi:hypothetical protein
MLIKHLLKFNLRNFNLINIYKKRMVDAVKEVKALTTKVK